MPLRRLKIRYQLSWNEKVLSQEQAEMGVISTGSILLYALLTIKKYEKEWRLLAGPTPMTYHLITGQAAKPHKKGPSYFLSRLPTSVFRPHTHDAPTGPRPQTFDPAANDTLFVIPPCVTPISPHKNAALPKRRFLCHTSVIRFIPVLPGSDEPCSTLPRQSLPGRRW